jgi:hypothetical protein
MAVEINFARKAIEFTYDTSLVVGETIRVKARNADSGDVGEVKGDNDGRFVLTYPYDFTGVNEVTVTGSESGEDTGTVTIGG